MGKIIRLTESDLVQLIKRVISEQSEEGYKEVFKGLEDRFHYDYEVDDESVTLGDKKMIMGNNWTNFYNSKIKDKEITDVFRDGDSLRIYVNNPRSYGNAKFENYEFKVI